VQKCNTKYPKRKKKQQLGSLVLGVGMEFKYVDYWKKRIVADENLNGQEMAENTGRNYKPRRQKRHYGQNSNKVRLILI
jgi:hypothetical protein